MADTSAAAAAAATPTAAAAAAVPAADDAKVDPMETRLEQALDDIMAKGNVSGVVICDASGLSCGARGNLKGPSGAYVRELVGLANSLSPSSATHKPLVVIESDNGKLFISPSSGGASVAVSVSSRSSAA